MSRFDRAPHIPIGPVLEALATESVVIPTGVGWVRCRCVFHEDRSPSAAVNHQLRAYRCFSCGVSGDAIKVIREVEGLSFKEALERALSITGVTSEPSSAPTWGSGLLD